MRIVTGKYSSGSLKNKCTSFLIRHIQRYGFVGSYFTIDTGFMCYSQYVHLQFSPFNTLFPSVLVFMYGCVLVDFWKIIGKVLSLFFRGNRKGKHAWTYMFVHPYRYYKTQVEHKKHYVIRFCLTVFEKNC